jgi:hypothetical protein
LRNPQVSRAVEYRIDEAAQTATHVWEYRHVPDICAAVGGSAQRLAGDDTLIAWGTAGVATEVDPLGVVAVNTDRRGCGLQPSAAQARLQVGEDV